MAMREVASRRVAELTGHSRISTNILAEATVIVMVILFSIFIGCLWQRNRSTQVLATNPKPQMFGPQLRCDVCISIISTPFSFSGLPRASLVIELGTWRDVY